MGPFSVFFTQSASFLAHQEDLKRRTGQSNAESLFGIDQIPSDNQLRTLLDPVAPAFVIPVFRDIYRRLDRAEVLKGYRSHANCLLIALDGTEYFSSKKIHCEQCSRRELSNGAINYFHSVLTPVIVQSGNERVIALEPEYITPQDGQEKQDCEIQAGKRWVDKNGDFYAKQGVILLGDDLFSLNLLAFLFHTVLDLVDQKYRLIRQALRTRQKFFQHIEALLCYLQFSTWDQLFAFMCKGLDLDTG